MLVDAPDADGQTPLYAACAEGHAEVAELLLTAGANGFARFPLSDGMTLLHVAAAFNRLNVLELLLDQRGVDVDARDDLGARRCTWRLRRGPGTLRGRSWKPERIATLLRGKVVL
mmetsp:Transcript_4645/g.11732  ORF Transcript_4645/g.11732 Transcript_4645/m.11732 type:complete len:115 (-) Transcript_4645:768-1112(-)